MRLRVLLMGEGRKIISSLWISHSRRNMWEISTGWHLGKWACSLTMHVECLLRSHPHLRKGKEINRGVPEEKVVWKAGGTGLNHQVRSLDGTVSHPTGLSGKEVFTFAQKRLSTREPLSTVRPSQQTREAATLCLCSGWHRYFLERAPRHITTCTSLFCSALLFCHLFPCFLVLQTECLPPKFEVKILTHIWCICGCGGLSCKNGNSWTDQCLLKEIPDMLASCTSP